MHTEAMSKLGRNQIDSCPGDLHILYNNTDNNFYNPHQIHHKNITKSAKKQGSIFDFSKQLDRNKKLIISPSVGRKKCEIENVIKNFQLTEEAINSEHQLNKFLINNRNRSRLYNKIKVNNEEVHIPNIDNIRKITKHLGVV
jgi:hypothetical protein